MASGWQGSTRRQTLGKEYFRNRAHVMRRDRHQCQIRTPGLCIGTATDCDHIGDRLDHRPENMRAACSPCHSQRSGQQGGQAAGAQRRARAASRLRTPEAHPGVVPPASDR
jgi:5-methylcytosine-specific restriction endonuclease McrA